MKKALYLLILILIGCSCQEKKWEEAKSGNTISAFKEFIKQYPESRHVAEAKNIINEHEFITLFPNGQNRNLSKVNLDSCRKAFGVKCLSVIRIEYGYYASTEIGLVNCKQRGWYRDCSPATPCIYLYRDIKDMDTMRVKKTFVYLNDPLSSDSAIIFGSIDTSFNDGQIAKLFSIGTNK